ncbi:MAG TPA: hypothetical protein VFU46_09240 [Gemmatimonadales bacterium]|nr:hypothetical protein [Gemmatimonadales bacterium]
MADPPIAIVHLPPGPGPVSVDLASPQHPQTLAGVLWRYAEDKSPEGRAGEFTPGIMSVAIGSLASNRNKFFLLEGAVLHHNDPAPTPYQVVVSILRDGRAVHAEVPPEGGTGQIKDADVPFVYRFQLQEGT